METPVPMSSLYSYMKAVLKEFGLGFHQMDQLTITFHENHIKVSHGDAWVATSANYIRDNRKNYHGHDPIYWYTVKTTRWAIRE